MVTKDGYFPVVLNISRRSRHQVQDYCHELGHLIIAEDFELDRYKNDSNYKIRIELLAHRIGRALCPPPLYNEQWAKCGLLSYFNHAGRAINFAKLQIIPLNYKGNNYEVISE